MSHSKYILISVALLVVATLLGSCSSRSDSGLERIAAMVSDSPVDALDSLRRIDSSRLSEDDRHFYDFLKIKASDKAFINHTSDSLILDVIDYYSSHRQKNLYPEALYYGGRVYSDIGDYPTSLSYYQKAAEELPDDYPDKSLESRIASQTGWLLVKLRLFKHSIPYIEKAISVNLDNRDTVNLVYDYQLLASSLIEMNEYDKAELNLRNAAYWARFVNENMMANIKIDMANVKLYKNQLDSAADIIRYLPELVAPEFRNLALAAACNIYMEKGEKDTAYRYACELVKSSNVNNREHGYRTLLSPELRDMIPEDSLVSYVRQYNNLLQDQFNGHGEEQSLIQVSRYNYSLHDKKRQEADRKNKLLVVGVTIASFIILGLLAARLGKKLFKKRIGVKESDSVGEDGGGQVPDVEKVEDNDVERLKKSLMDRILAMSSDERKNIKVDDVILKSRAYRSLISNMERQAIISDNDGLWENLERTVEKSSWNFKNSLFLLTGGKIKDHEYKTAILLKCGVSPMQISYITGRSKGAISGRRESLGLKIFGEKVNLEIVDAFIQLL